MNNRLLKSVAAGLVLAAVSAGTAAADRLSDMISPVTNPVNFEDPRISTEIRPIYMYHKIDKDFITQGGDARLYALQARFKVNDDLAIIATKDGFIDLNPKAVLNDETGWANVTAGVKYALFQDKAAGQIVTAGLRYEIPMGNRDVLQGHGDGQYNPFLSAAMAAGPVNVMAGAGFRMATSSKDSSFFDADFHMDVPVCNFYPSFDVSVVHVLSDGDRLPIADEGADLFNFGASDSDGRTLVTGGVGGRYRINDDMDVGVAYQFPMTSGKGSNLFSWRITTDLIWRFSLV